MAAIAVDMHMENERPQSSSSDWSFVDLVDDAVEIDSRPKPKEKYPAKLHAKSVVKRLAVTKGLIYLPGLAAISYEDSDQPVHFRQRRYFFYLSGINFPGVTVTYDISRDDLCAWIQPPNMGSNVIFNGSNPTREVVRDNYDFDTVKIITELDAYVAQFAEYGEGKIFLLHNYQAPRNIPVNNAFFDTRFFDNYNRPIYDRLFDCTQLKPAMDAARAIKSPFEIKMIRKASEITAKAHTNVLRSIKNLSNEAEIEAIFTATCVANQAKEQAYGVIAGSGANASTLHYIANNEPLKGRQLVCLDAGCEWNCYASDVTRTFPVSGKFSKEAKEIYDLVEQMQEECIKMVKPGANYRDIHLHAHKVATKGLIKLGLLNGAFEELYAAGASVAFFPHGLGHYLGLECHDLGDGGYLHFGLINNSKDWQAAFCQMTKYPHLTSSSILEPNQILTVEPGIYFSQYALEEVYLKDHRFSKYINRDLLKRYYPVGGVRIEDDILVTKDGYENLTTAPKGEEALKIINRDDKGAEKQNKGWFW